MHIALSFVQRLRRDDEGQDLLEYGLLASLIAIVAMAAVAGLGTTIMDVFWTAIAGASV
jgi:Flp pilus assembly pilin Flp